jgi:hypothetical protein
MSLLSRFGLAIAFFLVGGIPAIAADPPADWIWGQIQYDDTQGRATGIDKVVSVVFDNFQIVSNESDGDLTERKMLGLNFPLKLPEGEELTAMNADFRGHFIGSEGAAASLVVLIGREMASMQFPSEPAAGNEGPGEPFMLSWAGTERFASGSYIPITIVVVVHKPSADSTFLFALDSIDMAAKTE